MASWLSDMLLAGAATRDITPPSGLFMAGYVARTDSATGAHDPLSVRAIVYGECAIVVADVIGISADLSQRVRERACLPAGNIIIAALHTHGAPASMPGQLGQVVDQQFVESIEQACIEVIADAVVNARPCQLSTGSGPPPGIAKNRRHNDGLVDDNLPVIALVDQHGDRMATLVSYACHPVVLGADNLEYTADYPFYVRRELENAYPGSVALFITGAAADANTGHSAHDSITRAANQTRTFSEAQRIGEQIAQCAHQAALTTISADSIAINKEITLLSQRTEKQDAATLAASWKQELAQANGAQVELLKCWIQWAETTATQTPQPLSVRVTVMLWGSVPIVALPGEIFASTAQAVRKLIVEHFPGAATTSIVAAYADSNPGYIPPESEFRFGGYEVDEAHRYYGRPATFAPDSTARLLRVVTDCFRDR